MPESERQVSVAPSVTGRWMRGICNCDGRPARRSRRRCSIVTDDPVRKPDLAIYSQVEELQNGQVPSWDSPDITTNHWGPFRLMDEALVRVRNLSNVPAMNGLVHYYISPFGIGAQRSLYQTRQVNIAPNSQIELSFPLDDATLGGDPRIGVHIVIEHPHDPNTLNNRGAQVHDGAYTSEVGRTHSIQIPVLNDSGMTVAMQLSVLPTDVIATVTPSVHNFMPHEQIMATLQLDVPSFISGTPASPATRNVTVVARRTDGTLVGGATRLLRIDN